jgi:hypothetical protein
VDERIYAIMAQFGEALSALERVSSANGETISAVSNALADQNKTMGALKQLIDSCAAAQSALLTVCSAIMESHAGDLSF